jgi:hypothetical protein
VEARCRSTIVASEFQLKFSLESVPILAEIVPRGVNVKE